MKILSPSGSEVVTYPAFQAQLLVDSKSKVTQVQYFVDDKPLRNFTEPPFDGSVRVPRSVERTGTHTFKVQVTDSYFNTVEDYVMFTFKESN